MKQHLLPCPCCGSTEVSIGTQGYSDVAVWCEVCGLQTRAFARALDTKKRHWRARIHWRALTAWNQRTALPATAGDLRRARITQLVEIQFSATLAADVARVLSVTRQRA